MLGYPNTDAPLYIYSSLLGTSAILVTSSIISYTRNPPSSPQAGVNAILTDPKNKPQGSTPILPVVPPASNAELCCNRDGGRGEIAKWPPRRKAIISRSADLVYTDVTGTLHSLADLPQLLDYSRKQLCTKFSRLWRAWFLWVRMYPRERCTNDETLVLVRKSRQLGSRLQALKRTPLNQNIPKTNNENRKTTQGLFLQLMPSSCRSTHNNPNNNPGLSGMRKPLSRSPSAMRMRRLDWSQKLWCGFQIFASNCRF